jgi:hypothetical protein
MNGPNIGAQGKGHPVRQTATVHKLTQESPYRGTVSM